MVTEIAGSRSFELLISSFVKDRVNRIPVRDIEILQSKTVIILATINEEIMKNTWRETKYLKLNID